MGESRSRSGEPGSSVTGITWYDADEFACELSQLTGRNYRLITEAEWEFAAKNYESSLADLGSGEEWVYNSWSTQHTAGTDPVGQGSGQHTQKTLRDPDETVDIVTGRRIRSIDGIGPTLRLAVSAEMDYPPNMVVPCAIEPVCPCIDNDNTYRDWRWITGGDARWAKGSLSISMNDFDLRVWKDGTAVLNGEEGQWFSSNNIAFVFVPSTGDSATYPYIFLDESKVSVICDKGFMGGGLIGKLENENRDGLKKLKSACLIKAKRSRWRHA